MADSSVSVAARMIAMRPRLSPSELNVVATLLSDYPMAGLDSISTLARGSGVSEPTVTRLVSKLGFDGFADFKATLRAEVVERLATPVDRPTETSESGGAAVSHHLAQMLSGIAGTYDSLDPNDLTVASTMLSDPTKKICIIGGRFSTYIARHFGWSLQVYRSRVTVVEEAQSDRVAKSLELDDDTVCMAFDFRRYQADTIEFVSRAKRVGGKVILITDPYLSPLASEADVVLCAAISGVLQMNSMLPTLALCESLLSLCTQSIGEAGQVRLREYAVMAERFGPSRS